MRQIFAEILTLVQHIQTLKKDRQDYTPDCCPCCGHTTLWSHGCYARKSDRDNDSKKSLNPILIPRYYCPNCNKTCSTLPECIPPHCWYLWLVQQTVLLWRLSGMSIRKITSKIQPGRSTVSRWLGKFKKIFSSAAHHLKSKHPYLGYAADWMAFWQSWLSRLRLSHAMVILTLSGIAISC